MTAKILSVVVPTYNMKAYLPRCLDSVTREDVPDTLEVIVVNDGSKDRSLKIAKEYQAKRPDIIQVIDKSNGHYGSCINAALKVATGKYFRPLDADDWFDTDALIQFLKELEKTDVDLAITPRIVRYTHTIQQSYLKDLKYNELYTTNNILIYGKNSDLLCMHSMTYRLEILLQINLKMQEGICYTDLEYIYYPISYVKSICFYNLPLYNYDMSRDGQSMDKKIFEKTHSHLFKVISRILNESSAILPIQKNFVLGFCKIYYYRMLFCCECDSELNALDKLLQNKQKAIYKNLNKELFFTPWLWHKFGVHFFFYEKLKKRLSIET